jgi:hypothetical protein
MIIWSGWGVLTILFAVVGVVVGGVVGAVGGALVGGVVGGGAAATLNFLVAKALGGGKVMIDPATQQQVLLKKSSSLFFIPMTWFTPILALGGIFFGVVGMMAGQSEKEVDAKFPGKAVFEEANDLIGSGSGGVSAHGNTPAAEKAATTFGSTFKAVQSVSFEGGSDKYAGKAFLTYCHLGKGGVTFICQVPGMRKYKDAEAKKALSEIAWYAANLAAKEIPDLDPENTLTVGLRGLAIYGSIQQGKPGSESPVESEDMTILYKIFDPADAVAAE